MIRQIEEDRNGVVVELCYDMGELAQLVGERTQAVSATIIDKEGRDSFELLSATEDNMWELHRYANEAWGKVSGMTRRYHVCAPTIPDRDSVTKMYGTRLKLPATWLRESAIMLDNSIQEYMVSYITQRWWMAKGHTAQVEIEAVALQGYEAELRYSLNSRSRHQRGTQWI